MIPESGANEIGALGYLECPVELAGQVNHGAPRFDTVVIPAWSGVSRAGLLMGKRLAGPPSEIVGVPVGHSAAHVLETIASLGREEGVLLDPLCTVRALRALLETLRRDAAALGQRICFVHTGDV